MIIIFVSFVVFSVCLFSVLLLWVVFFIIFTSYSLWQIHDYCRNNKVKIKKRSPNSIKEFAKGLSKNSLQTARELLILKPKKFTLNLH